MAYRRVFGPKGQKGRATARRRAGLRHQRSASCRRTGLVLPDVNVFRAMLENAFMRCNDPNGLRRPRKRL
ncbi:Uncharacterised protein [Bordetella pertussis]|nr:Uncharacterised protein [Bordetella pertussis]